MGVFIVEMGAQGLMTHLGSQLIQPIALESHQNGNGVILCFLSKECLCHKLGVYASYIQHMQSLSVLAKLGQIVFWTLGFLPTSQLGLGLGLDCIRSYLGLSSSLGSTHDANHFGSDLISRHWKTQGLVILKMGVYKTCQKQVNLHDPQQTRLTRQFICVNLK